MIFSMCARIAGLRISVTFMRCFANGGASRPSGTGSSSRRSCGRELQKCDTEARRHRDGTEISQVDLRIVAVFSPLPVLRERARVRACRRRQRVCSCDSDSLRGLALTPTLSRTYREREPSRDFSVTSSVPPCLCVAFDFFGRKKTAHRVACPSTRRTVVRLVPPE